MKFVLCPRGAFVFLSLWAGLCSISQAQLGPDSGPPGKQKLRAYYKYSEPRYDAQLFIPVYQNSNNTYALTGKAHHLKVDGSVNTSNFKAVDNLYSYQYGFGWSYEVADKSTWSISATYGSTSDRPFEGSNVSALEGTLIRKTMLSENESLSFFMNYSNNRTVLNNIPLPGLAYTFSNDAKTEGGSIGIPFVSYWLRPTEKTFLSAFMLFPAFVQAQAGYMVWGPLQANLKYEYGQQSYLRSDRSEKKEQIFHEASKAIAGLKGFLGPGTFLELELAHVFSRSLYDGKSVFEITSDRMVLPNEWQFSAALQVSL